MINNDRRRLKTHWEEGEQKEENVDESNLISRKGWQWQLEK